MKGIKSALLLAALLWGGVGVAFAQNLKTQNLRREAGGIASPQLVFQSDYFDVNDGDQTVRIVNPTSSLLCAMIYVFDATEEEQECCGCPVTPNGIRVLSTESDLTANPGQGTGFVPNPFSGLIEIISSAPNGTNNSCDPGVGVNPTPAVQGWTTHVEAPVEAGSNVAASVDEFLNGVSTVDQVNIVNLEQECSLFEARFSKSGICTCGAGDNSLPPPTGAHRH